MSKHLHISVAESCHENWDAMKPNFHGKHCFSCQKTVVDFTNMTDAELINFFTKNNKGNTCGRFNNDQLQRDIPIPKKHVHWMKYFFQFTLPAFFLSVKASAQEDTAKHVIEIVDTTKSVQLIDSVTGRGVTDSVSVKAHDSTVLHEKLPFKITDWHFEPITISPTDSTNWQPMLTTVGFSICEMKTEPRTITFLDTLASIPGQIVNKLVNGSKPLSTPPTLPSFPSQTFITLFPSPIKAAGTLSLVFEDAPLGKYFFTIANNVGSIFQEGVFELEDGNEVMKISLLQLPVDDYLLTLIHEASKETFSQTFIVA